MPTTEKPAWRVLVHHKFLPQWNELVSRTGEANARELWNHLTRSPDRPPQLGCVTKMKGRPKGSRPVWHYELTGAGRIDYYVVPDHRTPGGGDPHPCVFIIGIDYGSH